MNEELGYWTIVDLRDLQAELALAVLSLVRAGAQAWSISNDEPTVALLRILSRLALLEPDVATATAAQVLELLRLKRRGG